MGPQKGPQEARVAAQRGQAYPDLLDGDHRRSRRQARPLPPSSTAEQIASGKAGRKLSNGQLLDVLSTSYNLENDPRLKEPQNQRMPDTNERPEERGIPEEVRKAIWDRSDGIHK